MTQIPVAPIEVAASNSHPTRANPAQALARPAQRSPRNDPTHDIAKASPGVSRPCENSFACTNADPLETVPAGKAGPVYQPPVLPSPDSAASSGDRKIPDAGSPATAVAARRGGRCDHGRLGDDTVSWP